MLGGPGEQKEQSRLLATNRYNGLQSAPDSHSLSVKQEEAVDLILAGKNDREVAESLGLHRVTVTRWRLYHPGFQAMLHRRRRLVQESSVDGLHALMREAVQAARDEIAAQRPGRDRYALAVIRAVLSYDPIREPTGEEDADEIVAAEADARHRKADQLRSFNAASNIERRSTRDDLLRKANEPPPADSSS